MTDAPNNLDEARARIRRLIDPYRDRDDLTDEQAAKVQAWRDALAVIGGEDVDERPERGRLETASSQREDWEGSTPDDAGEALFGDMEEYLEENQDADEL